MKEFVGPYRIRSVLGHGGTVSPFLARRDWHR